MRTIVENHLFYGMRTVAPFQETQETSIFFQTLGHDKNLSQVMVNSPENRAPEIISASPVPRNPVPARVKRPSVSVPPEVPRLWIFIDLLCFRFGYIMLH